MKLEVGESLVFTYLKHIQGCRIVQTNWKTSGKWEINPEHKKQAEKLFKTLKRNKNFSGVFGKNTFNQLIKQAEIDVLGIDLVNDAVWGVEVATHLEGSGLNYGCKEETIERVIKKLFRMVLITNCYFSDFGKYNVLFVTPKMQSDMKQSINSLIEEMNQEIQDEAIQIKLISDEEFFNEIVEPIISEDFKEHDTSEIFSRVSTFLKMKYSFSEKTNIKKFANVQEKAENEAPKNRMKIGQFVQIKMKELEEKGLLPATEILNLLTPNYSKKIFNQDFTVLKEVERGRKDHLGRDRYYANTYFGKYYLTSQWYERHWDLFLQWLNKFDKH
ncbi:hypothetical protein CKY20_04215 [Capnocytophaga canis]|uniref:Uncharacterized protein n=1 Tax=Capnocytophaga canis TaxID=1848903 RepID=A0A3A1YJB5_9FLAO|nr:hypothetical protein [Capnocytophaga canis]RIY37298.1 hypothetical protein CKY20_04215 [Capnocytophaga canis]